MKILKVILLIGWIIFYTGYAYCGTITFDSGATVSDSWLDNTFFTVYNEFNGNIDTDNIADGSITSDDIIGNTNPLNRDFHNIGEYVYSGLTIPTSANLTSTTTAGVAYVANDSSSTLHQVTTGATQKTYTASKDTYVFIDYTGAFSYDEVATGAAQPATPSNSIILAKVVTDGDNITAVTDLRQTTPPNLRVYTDYIMGCMVSRDISDADEVEIRAGEIEFGTGSNNLRRNTSTVEINFDVTGRGGLDTGSIAKDTFYYIFGVPDDDNDTNFEGIASLSSSDATGVTDERLIGWCYTGNASTVSPDSIGGYRGVGSAQPNIVQREGTSDISTTSTSLVKMTDMEARFVSSGRPVKIAFSAPMNNQSQESTITISLDDAHVITTEAWQSSSANTNPKSFHMEKLVYPEAGEHLIEVKWDVNGGTAYQEGATEGARILTVEEK